MYLKSLFLNELSWDYLCNLHKTCLTWTSSENFSSEIHTSTFFMRISCRKYHEIFSISLPINASCLYNMVLALTGSYWGWRRSDGWRNGTTDISTTDSGGNRGVDGRRKTAPASASSPGVCQIRIIHLTFLRLESQRTDFWTFWTDGVYIMLNIIPVLKG